MLAECHGEGSGLEVPAGTSAPRECSPHRASLFLWWTNSTMLASLLRSVVCANKYNAQSFPRPVTPSLFTLARTGTYTR